VSFQGAGHGLRLHDATRVNQFPRNQIPFPLQLLRFNFNPATIFLGDCGSMFIGFMLSALALVGSEKAPTVIAVAIPLVSFGLPILETTISVMRRLISGRPLFSADREHIHHKLPPGRLTSPST